MAVCSHCRSRHSRKVKYALNVTVYIAYTRTCANTPKTLICRGDVIDCSWKSTVVRMCLKTVSPPQKTSTVVNVVISWFSWIWSLHNVLLKWCKWLCACEVFVLLYWLIFSVKMIIVSLKNVRNIYSVQKANTENMWKKVCFVERRAARQCLANWQDTGFPVSPDYS